jgi:predicted component of type VI protein secretion system
MEAKLIVVGGKANRSEVKLKMPAMLGRGRDVDVTVAHATVSRHHCLIYELDGALVVRDNGSLNGTLVDGRRIKEAVLRPGQSLTIGPLTFRAEYDHDGGFPQLGLPAGEASKAESDSASGLPVVDTSGKPQRGVKPTIAASAAAPADDQSPPPKPAVAKSASDNFDFLDEDEPAGEPVKSPAFNFSNESEKLAGHESGGSFDFLDDEPSSAAGTPKPAASRGSSEEEVFRFADEPQAAAKKNEKAKPRGKSPPANGDNAKHSGVSVPAGETAKGGKRDDAELDDFLNSLGLDE